MESRRSFMRRTALGSSVLAVAGFAGCLDDEPTEDDGGNGDGGGNGDDRDYTAWLYDPTAYVDPELTAFTTVDVDRAKEIAGTDFEDELSAFEAELEDLEGVEELERMTGLAFGTTDAAGGEAVGTGVAVTGTFDADGLIDDLRDEEFDEDLVGRDEHEGYDVYAIEDDDEVGAMAVSEDAVVFGFFEGIDAGATEPVTAMIDEYESTDSSYYEAREDGADLIDRFDGNLATTGFEFDADTLILEEETDPMAEELYGGLVGVGSASDLEDGVITIDAALVYEDADSADIGPVEDGIEMVLEDSPDLADLQAIEDLEVREDGRAVTLSLSFDAETIDVDDPQDDPAVLLYLGAFPALAIAGAFVLDLGETATAEAQMGVAVEEDDGAEEVTVTVTSAGNTADAYIVTGTATIHDFEAKAGSSYTLSAEDGEYMPGDTIVVIGVTEDGTETVVTSFESGN